MGGLMRGGGHSPNVRMCVWGGGGAREGVSGAGVPALRAADGRAPRPPAPPRPTPTPPKRRLAAAARGRRARRAAALAAGAGARLGGGSNCEQRGGHAHGAGASSDALRAWPARLALHACPAVPCVRSTRRACCLPAPPHTASTLLHAARPPLPLPLLPPPPHTHTPSPATDQPRLHALHHGGAERSGHCPRPAGRVCPHLQA